MLQFISYLLLRFSFITSHDFMRDTHVQSSRIEIRMKRFNFEIVEIDMLVFYQACEEQLINFNLLNGSLYNNIDITNDNTYRIINVHYTEERKTNSIHFNTRNKTTNHVML